MLTSLRRKICHIPNLNFVKKFKLLTEKPQQPNEPTATEIDSDRLSPVFFFVCEHQFLCVPFDVRTDYWLLTTKYFQLAR